LSHPAALLPAASAAPPVRYEHRWAALAVLALVQLMLFVDTTAVNVALDPMQRDLGFGAAGLTWVVNGYALPFGGLLLLGGRLGDVAGRRRVFLAGLWLFAAASAAAGLSVDPSMLVLSRFLQGVGAALVAPAALSLVTLLFRDPAERTRAFSVWGVLRGSGVTAGVLLAGILVTFLSWRWVFFINLPIAAVAIVLAPRLVPESRAERGARLDIPGGLLVTAGVSSIVFGLVEKTGNSWFAAAVAGPLAVGVALLLAFLAVEARVGRPLVPPAFWRSRRRAAGNVVLAVFSAGVAVLFFSGALFMQQVLHYSPLATGLAFLPVGPVFVLGVSANAWAIARAGVRVVMAGGLGLVALALVLLAAVDVDSSYWQLLPSMILFPLGGAFVVVAATMAGVEGATGENAGLASGVNNAAQQLGMAVGLAAFVTIGADRTARLLATGADGASAATSGFALTFAATAALMLVGALAALVLLRPKAATPMRESDSLVS
jgi:MFS family permease